MSDSKDLVAAQQKEAHHAQEMAKAAKAEAVQLKKSAESEMESAQAMKGEARVKQPDDYSVL